MERYVKASNRFSQTQTKAEDCYYTVQLTVPGKKDVLSRQVVQCLQKEQIHFVFPRGYQESSFKLSGPLSCLLKVAAMQSSPDLFIKGEGVETPNRHMCHKGKQII